ncbi:MAG: hypothetical protein RL102_507 [Actinomycetota bacterium]
MNRSDAWPVSQVDAEYSIAERVRSRLSVAGSIASSDLVESLDYVVESEQGLTLASRELRLVAEADHELSGFGVLQPLLLDPEVEEIWMNDHRIVFFARAGGVDSIASGLSAAGVENLVARLLRNSSRRVDRLHPFADATLADGSRVHVVISPISAPGWSVNIRKFPSRTRRLVDLVALGMLLESQAQQLMQIVLTGSNFLVSGATNAGKTTLLAAMLAELPPERRVVSVEETHELRLLNRDWVALQGRAEGFGDAAPIDLRRLVRESLRMRPDALVIGEVRGAEALDLLLAMNSGIPAAGTIHAKSASAALEKLKLLPMLAQANIDAGFMAATVASVIDFVIHVENRDGKRGIAQILQVHR